MIFSAAAKNQPARIKSFVLAEANLNQGDYDGRTALHVVRSQQDSRFESVYL